jgi:hypothetical protein
MAYDVYGTWANTTGPLAPIYGNCAPAGWDIGIETGLKVMNKQGFKAQQIVLGLPAYAERLQLVSPKLVPQIVNGTETLIYQKYSPIVPVSFFQHRSVAKCSLIPSFALLLSPEESPTTSQALILVVTSGGGEVPSSPPSSSPMAGCPRI